MLLEPFGVVAVSRNVAQTLMHRHPASYLTFSLTKVFFVVVQFTIVILSCLQKTKAKAIKGNGWTGWLGRVWRRRPFISNCSDVSFWSDCLYHYHSGLCSAYMASIREKNRREKKDFGSWGFEEQYLWLIYILHFKCPLTPNKLNLNLSAQSANLAFSWLMIRIRGNDYWK